MYSAQVNQLQGHPGGTPNLIQMGGNQTGNTQLSPLCLGLDVDHNQAGMHDDVFTSGSLRGGSQQHAAQNVKTSIHDDVFASGRAGTQHHASQNMRVSGEGTFRSFNQLHKGPTDDRSPLSPSDSNMRQSSYPYHDQGNSLSMPTHTGSQPGMLHGNFNGGFSAGSQANHLPGSRGHTPFVFGDQGSRQPTHPHTNLSQCPYSCSSTGSLDGYPQEQQDHIISQLIAEVKHLAEAVNQHTAVNEDLKRANKELTQCLASTEYNIAAVRADITQMDTKTKQPSKTGVNDHPTVKWLIHPLFSDLCSIEQSLEKGEWAFALGNVQPLQNGKPYEVQVLGDKARPVWHLKWQGTVDGIVNARFIKEVAYMIWTNEKNTPNQGEIDDESYHMDIIIECAKTYFRNIHKQVSDQANPVKMVKVEANLIMGHHCARCAGVTKMCHKAATILESEKPEMVDAVGLIDTDFCTDHISYNEETLRVSMGVGYEWRSVDTSYVAFLCYLTLKAAKMSTDIQPVPAAEARRTIANKHAKRTFDVPPSMLSHKGPQLRKKPEPTIPVLPMVDPKCWLAGFHSTLGPADLLDKDVAYLKELEDWNNKVTTVGTDDADDEDDN
ncbi:hypothetical protein PAXRUDRAFT_36623 [Paxillus rubicundulus Ve08.2h10]|uniref:Uncharacterized protein n=1 Tax=Paxillus rubicundulus Ve08.2h10 TaxID=930991 RepID=A0A0D0DCX3_9AGAM|nr:hypothetical protein PAXRUDRAFT_36623 [Paxillus rubicundulus Ve08.2h10]